MAWELEIHIIDVGQGESSLIIAYDPATTPVRSRTMLIDGGRVGYAQTVHNYVFRRLGELSSAFGASVPLDHILVSHYDDDHSGGIIGILKADNLDEICWFLAQAAGRAAATAASEKRDPDHRIAAAAAAAATAVTALGGYKNAQNDYTRQAIAAGRNAYQLEFGIGDDAAERGAESGITFAASVQSLNPSILPTRGNLLRKVAIAAGRAAAKPLGNEEVRAEEAVGAVFRVMRTRVAGESRFLTGLTYSRAHIIDIGASNEPGKFADIIGGQLTLINGNVAQVPNPLRLRSGPPNLASEVLWRSGHGNRVMPAPPGSPAIFVVSRLKSVWRAAQDIKGKDNSDSIGLILRFNKFFYYSGGDLPSMGEEAIARAVMKNGLPNPQAAGSVFDKPERIACFKTGHHGSAHSTSQPFLNAIKAKAAFISNGGDTFSGETHPTQKTIDRLHNDKQLLYFYLTTCYPPRVHVPASGPAPPPPPPGPWLAPPDVQLFVPGNKSRVCGDNRMPNDMDGRQRGDIQLRIDEQASLAEEGGFPFRGFTVFFNEQRWERLEWVSF